MEGLYGVVGVLCIARMVPPEQRLVFFVVKGGIVH